MIEEIHPIYRQIGEMIKLAWFNLNGNCKSIWQIMTNYALSMQIWLIDNSWQYYDNFLCQNWLIVNYDKLWQIEMSFPWN